VEDRRDLKAFSLFLAICNLIYDNCLLDYFIYGKLFNNLKLNFATLILCKPSLKFQLIHYMSNPILPFASVYFHKLRFSLRLNLIL